MRRHLDLGCGKCMRNPYSCEQVFGIDLAAIPNMEESLFRAANLATEPIPFESDFFSSVSAYDFIEHVPRILSDNAGSTISPFIRIMNEVWRVLEPNGRFYAVTPAYPRVEAFSDPTHVNIITEETHNYFTEPHNWASMYGFTGSFRVLRIEWIRRNADFEPTPATFRHKLRRLADKAMGRRAHLLWEFIAVKTQTN